MAESRRPDDTVIGNHEKLALVVGLAAVALALLWGLAASGSGDVSSGLSGAEPTVQPRQRSAVLIVIDTLRQDRLSAYGYHRETSPVIDRLASEGRRLNGVSPSSWTVPATASILSGLHPVRHQTIGKRDALPAEVKTLPERLQAAGYQTAGISANRWISSSRDFDQGFDTFRVVGKMGGGAIADARLVNQAALAVLDELRRPFFLYVHYVDPHLPYDPPADWRGQPLPDDLAAVAPVDSFELAPLELAQRDRALVRAASDLYDGEIRFVDGAVGELLAAVNERAGNDVLTVITSDHGEELEDHGRMGHGHTLYSELTSVPLVFQAPGLVRPGSDAEPSSVMDIAPTVLEILGLDTGDGTDDDKDPPPFDGVSLRDRLVHEDADPGGESRSLLMHLDTDTGCGLALMNGGDTLIATSLPIFKGLFDIDQDPGQQRSLLGTADGAKRCQRAAERLADRYNALGRLAVARSQVGTVAALEREALMAMGYVLDGPGVAASGRCLPEVIAPVDCAPDGPLGFD